MGFKSYDLIEFRNKWKLGMSELARMLGVNPSQITRWEMSKQKIPNWLPRFLDLLDEKLTLEKDDGIETTPKGLKH